MRMYLPTIIVFSLALISACGQEPDVHTNASPQWEPSRDPAAVSPERDWSAEEKRVLLQGEALYAGNCTGCHMSNGEGSPIYGSPSLRNNAVIQGPKSGFIPIVLLGHEKMPEFGQWLDDPDVAAVLSYVRNAWENRSGDIVTPAEIREVRLSSGQ